MALYPDYATTADVKSQLRITDAADDAAVAIAVTAASRAIDKACNRQFGVLDTATARVFTWAGECVEGNRAIRIDDLMTLDDATAKVDRVGDGVTLTDFDLTASYVQLWPWNADGDVKPWTHLVVLPGSPWFPAGVTRELVLTAKWGWTTVPTVVKQACLIQAARFFVRRDSQYGVAGSPEQGNELRLLDRLDPDVAVALTAVRRHWGAV